MECVQKTTPTLTILTLFFAPVLALSSTAYSQNFQVMYSFADPPDGAQPFSSLTVNAGELYGTTQQGGADGYGNGGLGYGTIFKVSSSGKETVVYNFAGASDGSSPSGVLTKDSAGNLYGTTRLGGTCGEFSGSCGTVFKLDSSGHESVIYAFQAATSDAENPGSGVTIDAAGNLYGPAEGGAFGNGAIFKINSSGQESVLYSFGSVSGDGNTPYGRLILDAAGNLYGVTQQGGGCVNTPGGTVFKVDPSGNETTLYSFCAGAASGSTPSGPLVLDQAGNLYGVTGQGGNLACPAGTGSGCGTVFKLSASGTLTVLHTFQGGANDGAESAGITFGGGLGLVRGSGGALYGVTPFGGSASTAGNGTVYRITAAGAFTLLHAFNGTDGAIPGSPLAIASGVLYGTTSAGGAASNGTVFKLKP
jgi:uncharacterized repeat protein (TIGR03803 family)